ncbi:MAG: TolC family protein [Myxococcota bacterium]
MLFALLGVSVAWSAPEVVIGVVTDGPGALEELLPEFIEEISRINSADFEIRFPASAQRTGDWTQESVSAHLDDLLADRDVDLVLAMGLSASWEASHRDRLQKPVFAPLVVAPRLLGIPRTEQGTSGKTNFHYLSSPDTFIRDIDAFATVTAFDSLAVLVEEELVALLEESVPEPEGFDLTIVPVASDAQSALENLPADVDAVYLTPLFTFSATQRAALSDALLQRGLPSFSMVGMVDVEQGIMGAVASDAPQTRLARLTGLNVQRALLGERLSDLPVHYNTRGLLTLNASTLQTLQISPPWSILIEAEIVGLDVEMAPVPLSAVLQAAENESLSILDDEYAIAAGQADVRSAWSNWLPQIDASTTVSQIDPDQADATFGIVPEQSWNGQLNVQQLLWSDGAAANVKIQRDLQRSRIARLEGEQLDTTVEIGAAYLSLLRAKNIEALRREDVRRARTQLDLARVRVELGASNISEVLRLEAEIASAQQQMVSSNAQRRQAELNLNRLLNRPLDAPMTADPTSAVPAGSRAVLALIDNPSSFDRFSEIMASLALERSPELQSLNAAIAAQERGLSMSKRAFYSPDVGFRGTVLYNFERTDPDTLELDPNFTALAQELGELTGDPLDLASVELPEADELNWMIGISASIPIMNGGARVAAVQRSKAELTQLEIQQRDLTNILSLRVRAACVGTASAVQQLRLSGNSRDAAVQAYALTNDAYALGATTMLDIINARSTALSAEIAEVDALLALHLELLETMRSINALHVYWDEEARAALLSQLQPAVQNANPSAEQGTQP